MLQSLFDDACCPKTQAEARIWCATCLTRNFAGTATGLDRERKCQMSWL